VVLDDQEVSGIVGKSVRSNADEDMGRIVDIIVNQDGHVRAAIIDFGGFLGIGTRKIAVDWRALKFSPAGKPGGITLELTRNQVRVAPEYKRGEPLVVLGPAGPERTTPSTDAATPERLPWPSDRHRVTPANPTDAGLKAAGANPTIPRADRRGRHLLSRRSARRAGANAHSTGSRSSSPTCRPGSAPSSPSTSPRISGRRSTSDWY
jgi:hypothetical protein